jgi:hypothetical protein
MKPRPKELLDQVGDAIRLKHYSILTEEAYVNWIKSYILFHNKRHPAEMGTHGSVATPSATPSPPTCWKTAMISAPCRNSSGIRM